MAAGMMGQVDGTFTTEQRDLFASGLVAEIGVSAYAVWSAIKYYADLNTGEAFPGIRALGDKLGIGKSTVQRAIETLEAHKMLRIVKSHSKRRGQTYIARERLSVRVGSRVLCVIVLDYVPARMRGKITRLSHSLETGEHDDEAWADVEIIPGPGFEWDATAGLLRGRVAASELPAAPAQDDATRQLGASILARLAPGLSEKIR